MTVLAGLAVCTALLWGLSMLGLRKLHGVLPRIEIPDGPVSVRAISPTVSVIVPARNEEEYLPSCLDALRGERGVEMEILVLDDRSTDGTRAVAERCREADDRVRILSGSEPPEGWTGKNHALHQASRHARGEYLLFLDADTCVRPGTVAGSVALARAHSIDLLSPLPDARCATVLEALIQPTMAMLMLAWFDPRKVNDPDDDAAAAPGNYLLFLRRSYEELGGHAAVREDVVEDLRLAQEVKRNGKRLLLALAPGQVVMRRRLTARRLWDGWYRVIWNGLGQRAWLGLFAAIGALLLFVLPYFSAFWGTLGWLEDRRLVAAVAAVAGGLHPVLLAGVRGVLHQTYGVDRSYRWLQPVGGVLVSSLFLAVAVAGGLGRHRPRWSGRSYRGMGS
jgi:GT2 family glycosyltransferase